MNKLSASKIGVALWRAASKKAGLDEPARIHTVYTDLLIYNIPALTDLVPELLRQPYLETMCLASQWNR